MTALGLGGTNDSHVRRDGADLVPEWSRVLSEGEVGGILMIQGGEWASSVAARVTTPGFKAPGAGFLYGSSHCIR